jgi:CBS domain-containing protein
VNARISSMMKSPVLSVGMDDTVASIEAFMRANQLGWVPVREPNGAIVGVVSVSDLLQVHALKNDPEAISAWQICTYRPISVPAETDAVDVARLMLESNIHHVVVTEGDSIVGVVSSLDFVRSFVVGAGQSPRGGASGGAAATPGPPR